MKKKILILSTSALLMMSGAISGCNGSHETKNHEDHEHHIEKTSYQCPMKCEEDKTYDKLGNCPVCRMEMKEV